MGFRFQKRIKLGKNLGVHISKSGITPSYRNKRGSISSKGYAIRTGIPGVTYRKTFSKSKHSGCLFFLLILFLIGYSTVNIGCTNKTNIKPEKKWYQGGTLHQAKVSE